LDLDVARLEHLLRLGDNALVHGQRLSELIGEAPQLEEEMALANIALDLIGRAHLLLDHAGAVEGKGRDADALAYRRDVLDFRNALLLELPNGDFAQIIGRIFLASSFDHLLYEALTRSTDPVLRAIAEKSLKETAYHLRHGSEWVIRLGDGTAESHRRMQAAIEHLWPYTGELFAADAVERAIAEAGIGPDPSTLKPAWQARVGTVLMAAGLERPADGFMHRGGKDGRMHTEHLGYLLAEMQFLPRAYPEARAW
jgi:ring-1,2-phenylacetyl-CoA epoxidase subunit PaaC